MAAENCYRRKFLLVPFLIFRPFRFFVFFRNYNGSRMDFPHEVRFSAGIGPAHFPAARHGYWCQCRCHFHLTFNVVAALKISQNKIRKSFKWVIARFYIRFLKDFERSDQCAEVVCHFHPTLYPYFVCQMAMDTSQNNYPGLTLVFNTLRIESD